MNVNRFEGRKKAALLAYTETGKVDNDLKMVTLIAEAYQELRIFGAKALEASAPVFAGLGKVGSLDDDNDVRRQTAVHTGEIGDDTYALHALYRDATTMKEYQEQQLPGWLATAELWRDFFMAPERGTREELDKYAADQGR